jgi:cytochrome b561
VERVVQTSTSGARWDGLVKTLHWTTALMLLLVIPAGFVMTWTYGPSFKDARVLEVHLLASKFHHTLGFLILFAALAWVVRARLRRRPPFDPAVTAWQRVLARLVHGALALLLILVPWSGWTALSALADSPAFGPTHIWFFGTDRLLPRIWTPLPFDDPSGYRRFGGLHIWLLWAGLGIVLLHVASALWHHFIRRDGVLRRMWPLADGPPPR